MIIRRLTREEWDRLKPIYKEFNELPPDPNCSAAIVAEENGEIVGQVTLQMVLHAEPLWVKSTHRGRYMIPLLMNKLCEEFPGVQVCLAHATSSKMKRFLLRLGFKQMDWTPFRWLRKEDNGQLNGR